MMVFWSVIHFLDGKDRVELSHLEKAITSMVALYVTCTFNVLTEY